MGFRMTLQTIAVLRVLQDHPHGEHYGLEISRAAELPSGSLYPILARLERDGWVTSEWEELDEHEAGRRRRRYYRLSPDGIVWAQQALGAALKRVSSRPTQAPRPGLAGA
jgi:DNA-binding PadR family transcriptional regulator